MSPAPTVSTGVDLQRRHARSAAIRRRRPRAVRPERHDDRLVVRLWPSRPSPSSRSRLAAPAARIRSRWRRRSRPCRRPPRVVSRNGAVLRIETHAAALAPAPAPASSPPAGSPAAPPARRSALEARERRVGIARRHRAVGAGQDADDVLALRRRRRSWRRPAARRAACTATGRRRRPRAAPAPRSPKLSLAGRADHAAPSRRRAAPPAPGWRPCRPAPSRIVAGHGLAGLGNAAHRADEIEIDRAEDGDHAMAFRMVFQLRMVTSMPLGNCFSRSSWPPRRDRCRRACDRR